MCDYDLRGPSGSEASETSQREYGYKVHCDNKSTRVNFMTKIFVAGHNDMVGKALCRKLAADGQNQIIQNSFTIFNDRGQS